MTEDNINSSNADPDSNDLVSVPAKRIAELERCELEAQIKDDILAWGKTRFWWVTLALTVVGVLGGSALITTTMSSLVEKKTETNINPLRDTAIEAVTAARVAESSLVQSTKRIEELEGRLKHRIDEFNDQLSTIKEAAANLQLSALAGSENVRSVSRDLESRLNRLEVMIADAGNSDAPPSMPDGDRDNSKYRVTVLANSRTQSLASRVVDVLVRQGFRASYEDIESHVKQLNSVVNSPIQQDVSALLAELEAIPKRNVLRNIGRVPTTIIGQISAELKKLRIKFDEDTGVGQRPMKTTDISIYLME